MSFLDSLGRGAAQGATAGFSDEAVAKILANLPGPDQSVDGMQPEYAAGSPEQDYQNSERASNAAAAAEHPLAYGAGSIAGGLPMAAAMPGLTAESVAGRIAAGGLTGGALGAVGGAGHADGRDIGESVGQGAGLGAGLGMSGAAAREALPYVKQALGQLKGPQPEPVLAGAQVNQAHGTMIPPRPTPGDMPVEPHVPRAPKPMSMKAPSGAERAVENERPTLIENIDPKKAYRDAAHRSRQAAPARGPQQIGDDTTPTGIVPPPKAPAGGYKNTTVSANSAPTVPAPASAGSASMRPTMPATVDVGYPTMPAPSSASMRPTMPASAPNFVNERPTMPDMTPIKPTLRPGSEDKYKEAVLRELAQSMMRGR